MSSWTIGERPADAVLSELSGSAWSVRENARLIGATAVGCVALDAEGRTWPGCNVEHRFRSHDIHAEVNAIGAMISGGCTVLVAVLVAAKRDRFTPCGACMDWIWEFGGPDCLVGVQSRQHGPIEILLAGEIMPHYPR